jgi:hypothetical protein
MMSDIVHYNNKLKKLKKLKLNYTTNYSSENLNLKANNNIIQDINIFNYYYFTTNLKIMEPIKSKSRRYPSLEMSKMMKHIAISRKMCWVSLDKYEEDLETPNFDFTKDTKIRLAQVKEGISQL